MIKKLDRKKIRQLKHKGVRKRISGVAEKPRMSVFRSAQHIYVQIIDDVEQKTLAAASSLDPEFKEAGLSGGNIPGAQKVGELIAQKALAKGITEVVYDRGGYIYHGRVAALADAAREGGLVF